MSAIAFTTKRKLNKAVKAAIADQKIPTSAFELYRDTITNEIGLIWRDLCYTAPIRARSDGSIFIGHSNAYMTGSIFDRGLTGFELTK